MVILFAPQCARYLRPYDVAVSGPFRRKLYTYYLLTIHDLTDIVNPAYNVTYTTRNMVAWFAMTGIYPFSRNFFSDDDFECAEVTKHHPFLLSLPLTLPNVYLP